MGIFSIHKRKTVSPVFIFLDVDGVLNCKADWNNKFFLRESCLSAFGECVRRLERQYDVRVVLSSTWRAGKSVTGDTDAVQYQNLCEKLLLYGVKIHATTPVSDKGRQAEIEYYIKRNNVENYIVIDDDPELFSDLSHLNFFQPNYRTGLTEKDVKTIIIQIQKHVL